MPWSKQLQFYQWTVCLEGRGSLNRETTSVFPKLTVHLVVPPVPEAEATCFKCFCSLKQPPRTDRTRLPGWADKGQCRVLLCPCSQPLIATTTRFQSLNAVEGLWIFVLLAFLVLLSFFFQLPIVLKWSQFKLRNRGSLVSPSPQWTCFALPVLDWQYWVFCKCVWSLETLRQKSKCPREVAQLHVLHAVSFFCILCVCVEPASTGRGRPTLPYLEGLVGWGRLVTWISSGILAIAPKMKNQ